MLSNAYADVRGPRHVLQAAAGHRDQATRTARRSRLRAPTASRRSLAEVADGVNYVLHQVMEPGGTGGKLKFGKSDLAGKTGTINDNQAVWYAGYSSQARRRVGGGRRRSLPYKNLIGQTLNGKKMHDASGSGHRRTALGDRDAGRAARTARRRKFVAPDDKTIRGDVKDLPFVNGHEPRRTPPTSCRRPGFEVAIAPTARWTPRSPPARSPTPPRGSADGAPEGSTVTIVHLQRQQGEPAEPRRHHRRPPPNPRRRTDHRSTPTAHRGTRSTRTAAAA